MTKIRIALLFASLTLLGAAIANGRIVSDAQKAGL